MKIVVLSRFCTGRVRHWGVVYGPIVLFKSDHKASCVFVLILVSTLMAALKQAVKDTHQEVKTEEVYVMPCGCYSDACYCGQYPTFEELSAMEAEADAARPIPEPMTDAEWIEAEELRNFFGRRIDD